MIKSYKLVNILKYVTAVYINGNRIDIAFIGGNRYNGRITTGSYHTGNESIQKALEESPDFGKIYTYDSETAKLVEQQAAANANPPADPPANPPADPPANPPTDNPPADPPVDNPPSGNQPANPPADPPTGNPPSGESGAPTIDPEIAECTNYTLAKNYILKLYPETKRAEIISEEKLREYAKSKGITFPEFVK